MPTRMIALLGACLVTAPAGAAELILCGGQITEGGFYVSGGGGPYVVSPESLVAYTAALSYDAADQVATFYFTPLIDDLDATQLINENLFPGVLRNDPMALVVDFEPPFKALMNFVELSLDKTTGQGHWSWFETCTVCDRSFDPSARATITSFHEVLGGDFDADGGVDGDDLTRWRLGFGAQGFPALDLGDADADLDVDGRDFLIWQRQLGQLLPAARAVPEPGTALLFLCMAAQFVCRGRAGKKETRGGMEP